MTNALVCPDYRRRQNAATPPTVGALLEDA
jgi:hypothetical protein